MKKILLSSVLILSGCGPLAIDMTVGWGANQSIKKTLEMDQKQTKAQTESGSDFWEGLFDVLPVFTSAPQPTPTPVLPKIQSITIDMEGAATPSPTPKPTKKKKITAKIEPCSRWVCADSIAENCICK